MLQTQLTSIKFQCKPLCFPNVAWTLTVAISETLHGYHITKQKIHICCPSELQFFPLSLSPLLEPWLFSSFQLFLIYIYTCVIWIFQNICHKYYVLVRRQKKNRVGIVLLYRMQIERNWNHVLTRGIYWSMVCILWTPQKAISLPS